MGPLGKSENVKCFHKQVEIFALTPWYLSTIWHYWHYLDAHFDRDAGEIASRKMN